MEKINNIKDITLKNLQKLSPKKVETSPDNKKDDKSTKKMLLTLTGLAVIGGAIALGIKKGKPSKPAVPPTPPKTPTPPKASVLTQAPTPPKASALAETPTLPTPQKAPTPPKAPTPQTKEPAKIHTKPAESSKKADEIQLNQPETGSKAAIEATQTQPQPPSPINESKGLNNIETVEKSTAAEEKPVETKTSVFESTKEDAPIAPQAQIQQNSNFEESISKQRKIYGKMSREFLNDDEKLAEEFKLVSQGTKELSKEEFEALKMLYAQKFEVKPFSISESTVSAHHSIYCQMDAIHKMLKKEGSTREIDNLVKKTDKEFKKLTPIEKNVTVYRPIVEDSRYLSGFSNDEITIISKAEPNDIIVPNSNYSGAHFERKSAEILTKGQVDQREQRMILQINIPKGSKVSRSCVGQEVLLPRGAKYKVVSKGVDPDGILNVVLNYIPSKTLKK